MSEELKNKMLNQIIEQAEKELINIIYDSFEIIDSKGKGFESVKKYVNSLITTAFTAGVKKGVEEEKERVREWLKNQDKQPEEETITKDIFQNTENMNRVFMRVGYRKALSDLLSELNKQEMNKPDWGQAVLIGRARFPKLARLLCKIFGHQMGGVSTIGSDYCGTVYYCRRCKIIK